MTLLELEKVYSKEGKYLGKISVDTDALAEADLQEHGILDDINHQNNMGYRKYKEQILKQKEYILRKSRKQLPISIPDSQEE